MDEITSVDVAGLAGTGDAVRATGDALAGAAGGIRSWEYALAASVPGAATCETAAAETARAWASTLTALAGQVRELGDEFRRTAASYAEADAFNVGRLRGSGHPATRR